MGATLVLAIWIASAATYQVALPFGGDYQLREYPNSEAGIESFMKWTDTPGHDQIDLICVAIIGKGEKSPVAQFWRDAEVKRIFFMNPLQIEVMTKDPLIPTVTAKTIAETCAEMFPPEPGK
jgi:hypothetical protein